MYYDNVLKIILSRLPRTLVKADGTLYLDFNLADSNTHVSYNYYIIRNDNNVRPTPKSREIVALRQVTIDGIYVDIVRFWTFDDPNNC